MKILQKKIMNEELSLEAMMTVKGGENSHDLVTSADATENYGTSGPPPLSRSSNQGGLKG